jgi:ribosomal protein S18 acetylase RimI-like enzyme
MDDPGRAAAADANLAIHFTWVQRQTAGMRVREAEDLVLTDGGVPCDTFNAACRARLRTRGAARRIEQACGWFGELGHPFSWWVGPADTPAGLGALLEAAGLRKAETELAMAVELAAFRDEVPVPEAFEVRRVRAASELRAFARINAANWSPPDPFVEEFYRRGETALLDSASPLWLYVGYRDGEPVATSELTVGGGVAGLYNIATLAPHRRRGYGSAMTLQPLRDARSAGHATGILQAAADGVGLYRRLGFRPFGEIAEYKPPQRDASSGRGRGIAIRRALPADAAPLAEMWTRSIRELCRRDHHGREAVIAEWCRQRTPATMAAAMADPEMFWLVAQGTGDSPLGVGILGARGLVHAIYVHPEAVRRGVGSALLRALEKEARRRRFAALTLESTATGRPFYLARGFVDDGLPVVRFGGIPAQPMRKPL